MNFLSMLQALIASNSISSVNADVDQVVGRPLLKKSRSGGVISRDAKSLMQIRDDV